MVFIVTFSSVLAMSWLSDITEISVLGKCLETVTLGVCVCASERELTSVVQMSTTFTACPMFVYDLLLT